MAVPTSGVFSVAFSADGNTVAAGCSDGQLLIIDLAASKVTRTIPFIDWLKTP
jgi:WD40 repeat protein